MLADPAQLSLAQQVSLLDDEAREIALEGLDSVDLQYSFEFWGRPSQLFPHPLEVDWWLGLMVAGRGSGKMLAMDTRVPTPDGWTTMGALRAGDLVLDETGRPCRVLVAHPPKASEVAYRLTFSDGTWLDACAEHQWVTWTHRDRKQYLRYGERTEFPVDWPTYRQAPGLSRWGKARPGDLDSGPEIRTSQQIVDTFRHSSRGDLNHCIPIAGALDLPERDLPIDPWLLGYWLGDGESKGAVLHVGDEDLDWVIAKVRACGEAAWSRWARTAHRVAISDSVLRPPYDSSREQTMHARLRVLNLIRNKHIPTEYLRASPAQRAALLAGLLDSDGSNDKGGRVEFTSTNERLAHGALELARTLSYAPVLSKGIATLNGVEIGPKYRVTWRAHTNPFTMPRKMDRWTPPASQALRTRHRMIRSFEPIEPVMMRCITVDSPNSMYLAGEAMVPTHNTRSGAEWAHKKAISMPRSRGLLVARTAADARDVLVEGDSGLLNVGRPDERCTYESSKRRVTWPNGSVATLFSAEEPSVLRGPQGHWALCDEIATWKPIPDSSGLTAWDNLRIATRLKYRSPEGRIRPQILALTTPKRTPVMKDLLKLAEDDPAVLLRRDSTAANAGNLDPQYLATIYGLFEGTRLATQELEGLMLEDVEGALWTQATLDADRVHALPYVPLVYVIAVDPSVAENPTDECGILVCASTTEQDLYRRQFFVVEDASVLGSPNIWASKVVAKAREYGAPVVAEINQGGALIRGALQNIDPTIKVLDVRARYGKQTRAEPVSLAFEQHRGHLVGWWPDLESQLCSWTPTDRKSPDRLDAMVWGATALLIKPPPGLYQGSIRAHSVAGLRIPSRPSTAASAVPSRRLGAPVRPAGRWQSIHPRPGRVL